MEMQEKLKEAKKVYEQLKAEEAERRKRTGPSEYDVFDASFMSQDISLRKIPDNVSQMEIPKKLLPTVQEAAEDESCAESATSESRSGTVEPPRSSSQDIIAARTEAIKNYVEQQSESVASGLAANIGSSESSEVSGGEHLSACNMEPILPGMDIEVESVDNEEREMHVSTVNMEETVDEDEGMVQKQVNVRMSGLSYR
ncbi:unnamed protein product, partial [Strongylus vulgaris]